MSKKKKNSKKPKKEVLIPMLIIIIGVAISLLIIVPTNLIRNRNIMRENARLEEGSSDYSDKLEFGIEEFAIPEDFKGDKQPTIITYRRQLDLWEGDLIDEFLEDVEDIADAILEEAVEKDIKNILRSNE